MQLCEQLVVPEGLPQQVACLIERVRRPDGPRGIARHEEHTYIGLLRSNTLRQFRTEQLRHYDVGEQHVEIELACA